MTNVYDFSFGEGLGLWTSWLSPSLIVGDPGPYDSFTRLQAPGNLDPNHIDGIGPIWLVAHLASPGLGSPGTLNLVDSTIEITIKTTDFVANGAKLVFWIASTLPGTEITEYYFVGLQGTNWAYTGEDLAAQLSDEWQTLSVTLDTNPANWTYAGNNVSDQGDWAKRYEFLPLTDTLSRVDQTLHLVLLGDAPDHRPAGFLDIAEIKITTQTPAIPIGAGSAGVEFINALEDTVETGTLAGNPAVVANPTYFALVAGSVEHGTVAINAATGEYSFTPDPDYYGATDFIGSARFRYTVSDGVTTSAPISVVFHVAGINDAPTTFGFSENVTGASTAPLSYSLRRGNDIDDDVLTFAILENSVVGGMIDLDATTGRYTFTPDAGFTGTAIFQYTVSDGQIESAAKTVQIEVLAAPPPLPSFTTVSNTFLPGDINGFVQATIRLAQAGDVNASYHYGTWLHYGNHVTMDEVSAAIFLQRAVGVVADAAIQLASLYASGTGVARDYGAARTLLEAWPNNAEALYRLALLKELGFGAPADPVGAAADLLAAAERGHADAMYTLGRRYLAGDGVPQDDAQAYFWLELGLRFNAGTGLAVHTQLIENNSDLAKSSLTTAQAVTIDAQVLAWFATGSTTNPSGITLTGDGVLIGGAFNDQLTGRLLGDTLLGFGGNDILIGGPGAANTLQGGTGDDIYLVELSGDTVFELAGEGNDTVRSLVNTLALRNNVENLVFVGTGNFTGTGNVDDNRIAGGAGDDRLNGLGGSDTAVYEGTTAADGIAVQSGAQVTISAGSNGTDVLDNFEAIEFVNGNDLITITIDSGNAVVATAGDSIIIDETATAVALASTGVLANDINLDQAVGDQKIVTGVSYGATAGALGAALAGNYGALTLGADGSYSYTADAATGSLRFGEVVTDVFTYTADDGDSGTSAPATITVTIVGRNDLPTLGADGSGTVTEDQNVSGGGMLTTGGSLSISDPDDGESSFLANTRAGSFGTFTVQANGDWTYSADNSNGAIQALGAGRTLTETFSVLSFDGAAQNIVTITIVGTSDGLTLAGAVLGSFADTAASDALAPITGSLVDFANDTDPSNTFSLLTTGVTAFGTVSLAANGDYSFVPDSVAINALVDGSVTLSFSAQVEDVDGNIGSNVFSITVTGADDLTTVSPITTITNDNAAQDTINLLTNAVDADHPDLDISGLSASVVSASMTAAELSAATAALNSTTISPRDLAAGTFSFAASLFDTLEPGEAATVTLSYNITNAGGGAVPTTATFTVTGELELVAATEFDDAALSGTNFGDHINGVDGDDTISGLSGNDQLLGGEGDDIIVGGSGDDAISGGAGNDNINGGSNNDTLSGGDGDDIIDGGSGIDSAILEGHWHDYTITANSTTSYTFVRTVDGEAFTDVITRAETIVFANASGALGTVLNDAPILSDRSFSVAETADVSPGGTPIPILIIGNVAAADVDVALGDTHVYAITGGNAGGLFSIDADGTVSLTRGLDFEVDAHTYSLTVSVTDFAGLVDTGLVTVTLTDLDDAVQGVTFTGPATVVENVVAGASVATASAADADVGSNIVYSLAAGGDAAGRFAINAQSGVVSVAAGAIFDFETVPSHQITIVATSGATQSSTLVSVAVTDTSEAIGPLTVNFVSIAEVSPNGTIVGTALATDPDAGSITTYALTDTAGGRFAINAVSGEVSVVNGVLLDFEQATSHPITILATSSDGSTSTRTETITITDIATETIIGTAAGETVIGGAGNDSFTLNDGDDVITGAGGNDTAFFNITTDGSDTVDLGEGNDSVIVSADVSTKIRLTLSSAEVGNGGATYGGGNAVQLQAENAGGAVTGAISRFDDEGIKFFASGAGVTLSVRDAVTGALTRDGFQAVVLGTSGTDVVTITDASLSYYFNGGAGVDNITGGNGNDYFIGGSGNDSLFGGNGTDAFVGGSGNNVINGGAGIDTIDYSLVTTALNVNLNSGNVSNNGLGGIDTVTQIENLIGGILADVLIGNASANVISGGLGADYLLGLDGNDTLSGGAGSANTLQGGNGDDTYIVEVSSDSIVEVAGGGIDTVRSVATTLTLRAEVENLIFVGTGNFTGSGNAGNNALTGGAGNDRLNGMAGTDTLTGGGGADQFRFSHTGLDIITDFVSGVDKIALASDAFSHVIPINLVQGTGVLVAANTQSTFFYNSDTGVVSYDRDGTGAAVAVTIATIGAGLTLNVGDFMFF